LEAIVDMHIRVWDSEQPETLWVNVTIKHPGVGRGATTRSTKVHYEMLNREPDLVALSVRAAVVAVLDPFGVEQPMLP
jgi:hypothetical protein